MQISTEYHQNRTFHLNIVMPESKFYTFLLNIFAKYRVKYWFRINAEKKCAEIEIHFKLRYALPIVNYRVSRFWRQNTVNFIVPISIQYQLLIYYYYYYLSDWSPDDYRSKMSLKKKSLMMVILQFNLLVILHKKQYQNVNFLIQFQSSNWKSIQ